MKRKPLQPVTMAQVLADIATMSETVFARFQAEALGPDAFDSDKERVEPMALRLGVEVEPLRLILNFLAFLYDEVNDSAVEKDSLEEISKQIVDTAKKSDYAEPYLRGVSEEIIASRLSVLLRKNDNIDTFGKSRRLRSGFSPVATEFASFVDLRPLLTEDRQSVLKLVPIVQFMISADSSQTFAKSYVFQMDRRRLKALKDAVDAAMQKLDVIERTESLSRMIR